MPASAPVPHRELARRPIIETSNRTGRAAIDRGRRSGSGPKFSEISGEPSAVWITAESLGDDDPALRAHARLPAIFVFDEPLLRRLRLSGKRLVFLADRLAELGTTRDLTMMLGNPTGALAGQQLAATYTPVLGWKRIADTVQPVALHPWPWLRRPGTGSAASFSAWRTGFDAPGQ